MYSDRKKNTLIRIAIAAALLLLAVGIAFASVRAFSEDLKEESAAAIADAIQRSALQCYVVEGVYPPSLDYLESNYGLKINHAEFYVHYDAFASNLPPTVQVVPKHE